MQQVACQSMEPVYSVFVLALFFDLFQDFQRRFRLQRGVSGDFVNIKMICLLSLLRGVHKDGMCQSLRGVHKDGMCVCIHWL